MIATLAPDAANRVARLIVLMDGRALARQLWCGTAYGPRSAVAPRARSSKGLAPEYLSGAMRSPPWVRIGGKAGPLFKKLLCQNEPWLGLPEGLYRAEIAPIQPEANIF
jgi:hypothetical protein